MGECVGGPRPAALHRSIHQCPTPAASPGGGLRGWGEDIGGLAGVEVLGGGRGEGGLDHDHEFGSVFAVVDHGRCEFDLGADVADGGGAGGGLAVEADVDGSAVSERGEGRLGHVESDLEVGGGEETNDGGAGRDELAGAEERVMDAAGGGRLAGLLVEGPLGLGEGCLGGVQLGLRGADFVFPGAEAGGLEVGSEGEDGGVVGFLLGAGVVEFGAGDDVTGEEGFAAGGFGGPEGGVGAGLFEVGFEGGDF